MGSALVSPGAAHAAGTPFIIDPSKQGGDPAVGVDENGVGHFAWEESRSYVSPEDEGADVLHYCQVPRNGKACAKPASFTLGKEAFHAPRILLPGGNRVVILAHRCCGGAPPPSDRLDALWLVESLDGGASWAAPRPVGSLEPSGDAEYGPGEFSASVITDTTTGGVVYQAVPLGEGAYTHETANLGNRPGQPSAAYYGDVAFQDPLTPITVMTDLDHVYFRKWSGAGNYNDVTSWGPLQEYGAGDDTQLVGGKRGVFMSYKTEDFPRQYRFARWGGMGFGASAPITGTGDPIFADLFQDNGGNLHFLWSDEQRNLKHRVSRDGQTWKAAEQLTNDEESHFHLEHAAARDGGGFAVWDNNSAGPVRAVQFGPTGAVKDLPEDESCVLELKVGSATVVAREGCLKRQEGTQKYTTNGDIRVNGIDIYTSTAGSSRARAAAKPKITIDKNLRTLITGTTVEAKVGNVVLERKELSWKLPGAAGQIQDLAGNPAPFDTGKFDIKFLGLRVLGQVQPKLLPDGSVELPVHLELPPPLGALGGQAKITGDMTLIANVNTGLKLTNLKIHAEHVNLGIAEIHPLDIEYIGDPSKLYGKVKLLLPVISSELLTEFQFTNGDFDFGKADLTFTGQGVAVASGVFLKKINFSVVANPKPTKISGGVQLNAFGTFGSTPVLQVDGTVSYTFPNAPAPGIFRVQGNGKLIGLDFASVFAQYETTGKISFGGEVHLGNNSVLGISGGAEGEVDVNTLKFNILGKAHVCAFSICAFGSEILISSASVAGCVGGSTLGAGARYVFSSGELHAFWTCDLAEYKVPLTARASQGGGRTVQIKGGQKLASIQVVGQGGSPRVTVTGPGGQTIASPADQSQPVVSETGLLIADAESSSTVVNLKSPQGGTWTITPQSTSVPIASVRTANALPEPSVKAVVRGKGHTRTLHWKIKQIPGQTVRLSEEGDGAFQNFGQVKGATGKLKFKPANGKKGKRTITAIVTQDGIFRESIAAGTYTAPGPQRPGKPRRVRLKRKGTKLVITWRKAPRAAEYAVRASLKDGRRLVIPTKKRKVTIGQVPGIDSGQIWVYGVKADQTLGPPAKAKLKAKPKKRKKRRPRR